VERLRQLAQNKDYENPIKAELGFIAAVFRQEAKYETNVEKPMAEIYLKGGKSVWMPYAESDEYIAANVDNLEYRKVETRRPRVRAEESQL
jgi:hypothetical protein